MGDIPAPLPMIFERIMSWCRQRPRNPDLTCLSVSVADSSPTGLHLGSPGSKTGGDTSAPYRVVSNYSAGYGIRTF